VTAAGAEKGNAVFTEHEMSASARRERRADAKRESIAKWVGEVFELPSPSLTKKFAKR
jgi:hypothetical protein